MNDLIIAQFTIPGEEFSLDFTRSSGPGGQNVNKVNSKVILRWNVKASSAWSGQEDALNRFINRYSNQINKDGELVIKCQETRNQLRNKERCLEKLTEMILKISTAPKERKPLKPSLTARQRRREQKVISHRIKQSRLRDRKFSEDD